VWNAHNTVLGKEALLIHIVPVGYLCEGYSKTAMDSYGIIYMTVMNNVVASASFVYHTEIQLKMMKKNENRN